MRYFFLYILFIFFPFIALGQADSDMRWWNDLHNWEVGDPGWREMMTISPGFFGPNGLPVPEVKKGLLHGNTEIEIMASNHFHNGDPTQDISGKFFIPFAKNRIAIEMYGVLMEHFAFSEEIRNERISRIENGKGYAVGDFYFSTLIQVFKDRKFPNTLFRFATKTASGRQLEGARFTDTPGYFFDFSFSKEWQYKGEKRFKPFAMIGFYSWQTNDWLNLQNDAILYALGADLENNSLLFSASLSGYSGYKEEKDKPVQINLDLRKDYRKKAIRLQYNHGLRHLEYKTLRISFIWKLNPV